MLTDSSCYNKKLGFYRLIVQRASCLGTLGPNQYGTVFTVCECLVYFERSVYVDLNRMSSILTRPRESNRRWR